VSTSLLGIADAVHTAKKKPSALDAAQADEQMKFQQLKIQVIEACKSDPSQSFCVTLFN
jgi:azurin